MYGIVRTALYCHVMYRLTETSGSARLSLVSTERGDHTRQRRRGRPVPNGCVAAPLNKSRSVGCCRSLIAYSPTPVSRRYISVCLSRCLYISLSRLPLCYTLYRYATLRLASCLLTACEPAHRSSRCSGPVGRVSDS